MTWSLGWTGVLLAKRLAGKLGGAVGDHLVDVHVELGAAARHPHVQRKHVVMFAGEDFVADRDDQRIAVRRRAASPA